MTTQITISDIVIHQDREGRYSINDLHKASGNERRHEPKNWLNIQQTKELIEVIVNTGISVFTPIHTKRGCKGGTYVCKELVYSYAMWISAAFALEVIRAYDDLVTGRVDQRKTTTDDRTPLRDAINMLVGKKGIMYPEAYSFIHQRFNVAHIDELEADQLPVAVEYVHRLVLEGEFLGKQESLPAPITKQFTDDEIISLCYVQLWMEKSQRVSQQLYPAMEHAKSEYASTLYDIAHDISYITGEAKKILLREAQNLDKNDDAVKQAQPMLAMLRGEERIH